MGQERRVRRRRGPVDGEERSRDAAVRPAPAIQKLCAVRDFLGERMPEGERAGRLGRTQKIGRRELVERRGQLGSGHIDHGAQQLHGDVPSDHRRRLEHVLVARRESIDA